MRFLLDTDVCVDYLRARQPELVRRIRRLKRDEVCISSVVAAELRYGAQKSRHQERSHYQVELLTSEIPCLAFDAEAALIYGEIRADLESRGQSIGFHDMMIAAHACRLGCILVSNNLREFRRVEGLRVESWRPQADA